MSLPSFSDLGKNARDVFRTGYHYGKSLVKLNVRAQSTGNVAMSSDLRMDCDTSKLSGTAEAEYKTQDYGSLIQKWTTDGTVTLGINLPTSVIQDVGLQSEISYNPGSTAKTVKFGAKCSKQHFNAACSLSSDMNWNVNVVGSVVTTLRGLLVGYQGAYNSESNKITKNDVGLAFSYRDVAFHFRCMAIPYEYGLSLLYKVNSDWDAALNGVFAKNGGYQDLAIGVAAKCKIDDNATFRCKFNSDLQLGMSLQQKMNSNVMLTMSFNIDCANVTRGGHKVGLAIEIDG